MAEVNRLPCGNTKGEDDLASEEVLEALGAYSLDDLRVRESSVLWRRVREHVQQRVLFHAQIFEPALKRCPAPGADERLQATRRFRRIAAENVYHSTITADKTIASAADIWKRSPSSSTLMVACSTSTCSSSFISAVTTAALSSENL